MLDYMGEDSLNITNKLQEKEMGRIVEKYYDIIK